MSRSTMDTPMKSSTNEPSPSIQPLLAEALVLVVGAGPIGLLVAYQLAKRGISTILIERNHETTRWPKMDITNARSMELLNHIGLADGLRKLGSLTKMIPHTGIYLIQFHQASTRIFLWIAYSLQVFQKEGSCWPNGYCNLV
jgi:choline dehydrogenase-like flavoprotein